MRGYSDDAKGSAYYSGNIFGKDGLTCSKGKFAHAVGAGNIRLEGHGRGHIDTNGLFASLRRL